jgi:hypothetical protein
MEIHIIIVKARMVKQKTGKDSFGKEDNQNRDGAYKVTTGR